MSPATAVHRSLSAPVELHRPALTRQPVQQPARLPAWPLLALLYGFPLYWVTGLSLFAPVGLGAVMAIFLILRGRVRITPGVLCWGAFLAWVVVCAVSVTGFMEFVGFAQRAADLFAVGVALLYYVNARESLSLTHLLRGFTVLWGTVVVLGLLATQFPTSVSRPRCRWSCPAP